MAAADLRIVVEVGSRVIMPHTRADNELRGRHIECLLYVTPEKVTSSHGDFMLKPTFFFTIATSFAYSDVSPTIIPPRRYLPSALKMYLRNPAAPARGQRSATANKAQELRAMLYFL